jgi:hypothetical protein
LVSACASGALSPETVSGEARRFVFAGAGEAPGASGELPRISSIGVASATLPPYSPIDSEIAPALRPSQ